MRYVIIVLIPLVLLTACTQGHSRALPDLVEYTKQEQVQAAEEITPNCKNRGILCEFMKDYKVMRDQTRKLKHGR